MNRRIFLSSSAASAAVLAFSGLLTGCGKLTTQTAGALAQVLGSAVASLAVIIGNATLAGKITTVTATLVGLINTWVPGTTTQNIIQAITDLETLINSVETISPEVTALVTLALGTIQAILALFPPSVTGNVSVVAPGVRAANLSTIGVKHAAKDEHTFRGQWNTVLAPIAKAHPKFAAAKL